MESFDQNDWPGLTERHKMYLRGLLPRPKRRPFLRRQRKGGRPRADDMLCLEAILWKAWTGLSWRWLPAKFGKKRTVLCRLELWQREWRLTRIWREYARISTRAEALRWKGRLCPSLMRRKVLWKSDLMIAFDNEWPSARS